MERDIDIRNDLYGNIVLSEDSTMFSGIAGKVNKDVAAFAPSNMKIRVVTPPARRHSVWIGGSISASLGTFQQIWVSKSGSLSLLPAPLHLRLAHLLPICMVCMATLGPRP